MMQQPMQPGVTVVQAGKHESYPMFWPEHSIVITCHHCGHSGPTLVIETYSSMTWILFWVMCIFGFWLCCCIPMCISSLNNQTHSCGHCHKIVGQRIA